MTTKQNIGGNTMKAIAIAVASALTVAVVMAINEAINSGAMDIILNLAK